MVRLTLFHGGTRLLWLALLLLLGCGSPAAAGRGRRGGGAEGHACDEFFAPPLTPGAKAGGVIERGYGTPPVTDHRRSLVQTNSPLGNTLLRAARTHAPTHPRTQRPLTHAFVSIFVLFSVALLVFRRRAWATTSSCTRARLAWPSPTAWSCATARGRRGEVRASEQQAVPAAQAQRTLSTRTICCLLAWLPKMYTVLR
jgi:hypothetical protein